ncbi:hypothetical protein RHMOL_Rhmol01G0008900 [Rhododendron molle]|uniref:Uncharacterized protein n=1 Tax=Rhododendron molle TaxID=49168 RepID=A0ACC0PXA8_RHOML|nr:hypothetical protein RHMOL_Rhmol01G0008900 [Rhododendron molle]
MVLNRDWASLPTDLLCLMLPHLFLGDIKRFHNVFRSWQLTTTSSVQSLVLKFIGNDNTRCKHFHPLYKSPYSMYIPELFGAVPRFCKDGWLLMSRGERSMFFFNPFTKALINMPDLRVRVLEKPHRQPDPPDPFLSHERNFLVKCNGELLSVSLSFMGKSISVSKLDSVEITWHKVDSLGDQMLFVSNTSSLSAKGVVQGMENKIYLPKIHGKCGVFYSLASRLFQTFGNDFSCKDWYGTGELLSCCWIEPKADTPHSKEELNWFEDALVNLGVE